MIRLESKNNKMVSKMEGVFTDQNIYGSMAAGIAARLSDLRKKSIKEGLGDFLKEEHRLERVAFVRGVEFVNDSKATNINSTWYALETISKPIVWIAGGQDPGNDYGEIAHLVARKVKTIICLGLDNRKITKAFERHIHLIFETRSMEDAVKSAYLAASPGDAVLLSPACASFDLFENYEERGNLFKKLVYNL